MLVEVVNEKFNIIDDNDVLSTPNVNIFCGENKDDKINVIQGDTNANIYDYLGEVKEYLREASNKYHIGSVYIDNSSIYGLRTKNWMTKLIIEKSGNGLAIKNIKTVYELNVSALDSDYLILSDYIRQRYMQDCR